MQLVVVMAVRKAVSVATTTFTAISMIRFFIAHLLILIQSCAAITASVTVVAALSTLTALLVLLTALSVLVLGLTQRNVQLRLHHIAVNARNILIFRKLQQSLYCLNFKCHKI